MIGRRTALFCFLLLWTATATAQEAGLPARVDRVFAEYDKPDSPGCALGVIRNGEFVYERGYGMANLEYGIPLSSQSVFRIGSTSKQFSAMSVLLLEEQGKLRLDDDIRKYVPEIPDYGTPITIRHLLHHASGLRDYLVLMTLAGKGDDDFYTDEDVVTMLARQKALNFPPGEEWLYSNSGYFLLSQIVKQAAGQSLREFAAENIFGPLGMANSHFHDDYTEIVKNRASGYSPRREGGFRIDQTTLEMVGDGGVFTTVHDLLQWDQNFYHPRLGKDGRKLTEKMLTVGTLNNGKKLDYALGLRVSEYRGLRMVSHGGSFVGFRAEMLRFPEENISVICLCNVSSANPTRLARRVADLYLADRLGPEPEEEEETRTESGRRDAGPALSTKELEAYTGEYFSEELGVTYRLAMREGELYLTQRNAPTDPLAGTGPDRLRVRSLQLDFERGSDGRVTGFTVQAGRVRGIRFVRK